LTAREFCRLQGSTTRRALGEPGTWSAAGRSPPASLALAQYDDDPGIYLFYCDEDWNAVTDAYHDDLEHAVAQAEFEFGPVEFVPMHA
jgi:hypothetical protein